MPETAARIELYAGPRPMFDLHGVEEEIQRALDRKVPLKSGGYLVIDQTEAMTTIDVNTGAYVGHRNLEETIFRTNLEAAVASRGSCGCAISAASSSSTSSTWTRRSTAAQVLAGARAGAGRATTPRPTSSSLSPLGLVEMTRKRTRESLEHLLCEPCPSLRGARFRPHAGNGLLRDLPRDAAPGRQFASRELLMLAHQDVIERLLDEESATLGELEPRWVARSGCRPRRSTASTSTTSCSCKA